MFDPSPQLKKALSDMGRTQSGRDVIAVLEEAKAYYSDINTIDKKRDTNAQIEGRQLMCEMIDDLTKLIQRQKHRVKPGQVDDFT